MGSETAIAVGRASATKGAALARQASDSAIAAGKAGATRAAAMGAAGIAAARERMASSQEQAPVQEVNDEEIVQEMNEEENTEVVQEAGARRKGRKSGRRVLVKA